MTQETIPSQEEPKGVFDSVRQKRSVEIDADAVPETTAPGESGVTPDETDKSTKPDDRDDLLKQVNALRSKSSRLEKKLVEFSSWAQFGQAVYGDPKMGRKIAARYEKGQPLFDTQAEAEAFEEATGADPAERPLTREELHAELDQREVGRRLISELDSVAEEKLMGFRKVRKNPKFAEMLDITQQMVFSGKAEIDEEAHEVFPDNDFAARHYTAIKKAHRLYLADNPKVREALAEAKKLEDKDRKKAASLVPSSKGTTTTSQEEPEEPSETDDLIERMMSPGGGKRKAFRTIGRNSR